MRGLRGIRLDRIGLRLLALVAVISTFYPGVVMGGSTEDHNQAALDAWNEVPCARDCVTASQLQEWTNDPDCLENDCTNADRSVSPGDRESLCWACVNWSHFTSHGFPHLPNNLDLERNHRLQASQAIQQDLKELALENAAQAAHYAVDRAQCGHAFGNYRCDPFADHVTLDCQSFIAAGQAALLQDGDAFNWSVATGTPWYCSQRCGYSEPVAFAAAERYIRHHSHGLNIDGLPTPCDPSCTTGECEKTPGLNREEQIRVVQDVCDEASQPPDPVCGNSLLEGAEECEVGVPCVLPGEQCDSSTCQCEPVPGVCGDGLITPPEQCDISGDLGCAFGTACVECFTCAPVCGDGIVAGGERCETGTNQGCPAGTECELCQACTEVTSGLVICGDGICHDSERTEDFNLFCPADCGGTSGGCTCDGDGDGAVSRDECEHCCGGTVSGQLCIVPNDIN